MTQKRHRAPREWAAADGKVRLARRVDSSELFPARGRRNRRWLTRHGMDYPLLFNSGPKGAIVAALAARTRGPSAFVDDLIPNLDSAAEAAPAVHRFQLVADPRLAAVAPSAPDRHLRIDDWPRLRLAIARVLGADL